MWHLRRSVLALGVFERRLGFCSLHQVIGGGVYGGIKSFAVVMIALEGCEWMQCVVGLL